MFLLYGPAHRSAQAGLQAGSVAEGAGLRAGPDRAQGRAVTRGSRHRGRPRLACRLGTSPKGPAFWPTQAGSTARRAGHSDGGTRRGKTASDDQFPAALRGYAGAQNACQVGAVVGRALVGGGGGTVDTRVIESHGRRTAGEVPNGRDDAEGEEREKVVLEGRGLTRDA